MRISIFFHTFTGVSNVLIKIHTHYMSKKKGNRCFRVKPEIAKQMGLSINQSGTYRLNKSQQEIYFILKPKKEDPNDFGNESVTETNQYSDSKLSSVLSARNPDGTIMTPEVYCTTYGLDPANMKSWKLITHTGTPYYNIASQSIPEPKDSFDEEFVEDLIKKISSHTPEYKTFAPAVQEENNLLVIDIADLHLNKLSLAYETYEVYNFEIARRRAIDGFYGILKKAENFNVNRVMFVIGNDILHSDNAKSTTTSGTFQDTQSSTTEAFNVALDLYTELIDSIITKYQVDVVFNCSNHDYLSGWMLARTLSAWYRLTDRVTVYDDMTHRKYYKYGVNMICTSHGDGAKMADMPMLMATEKPLMWAETKYRYVYLHHIHHKEVTKFMSGKDYIGVTVEYLRSPSVADRWHSTNGFTGAKQAIEGFIHSELYGQVARITHLFG